MTRKKENLPTPIHTHLGGFYFWEESYSERFGPYTSKEEAELEFKKYRFYIERGRDPTKAEILKFPPLSSYQFGIDKTPLKLKKKKNESSSKHD